MRRKFINLAYAALPFFILLLAACDKSDNKDRAVLNVRLTDGPGNYDAVNIDVRRVEIHTDAEGWAELEPIVPGIYNLLDFRNGMDTLLCRANLPAGRASQMRLVLGSNNSIVVDGISHPLATPSAQQSGLKFNIHQDLAPNGSYDLWIDFDVARSVVSEGSGAYSLKPVIKTFTRLTDGRIKGVVLPPGADVTVYANGGADIYSAIPDGTGHFMFCGLPEGVYTLTFDADAASGFEDLTLPDINVTFGEVADVGTVTLEP